MRTFAQILLFAAIGLTPIAAAQEPEIKVNKADILRDLQKGMNWKILSQAMIDISKSEILRANPKLRDILKTYAHEHPISNVRASAKFTLSQQVPNPRIQASFLSGMVWYEENSPAIALNATRPYCKAPRGKSKPRTKNFPKFPKTKPSSSRYRMQTPSDAKRTKHGWLVGYDHGEFGGDLVYYPKGAKTGQVISPKISYNVMRIFKTDKAETYWVLTGLNHLVDRGSYIHKVTIDNSMANVETVKYIPSKPYKVVRKRNGDIFMSFVPPPYMSYNPKTTERALKAHNPHNYNPPLLFTKAGKLKSACEKNALEY